MRRVAFAVVFATLLAGVMAEWALCAAVAAWASYGPPPGEVLAATMSFVPGHLARWACSRVVERFPDNGWDGCYRAP